MNVVIEGMDGAGKSTVSLLAADMLAVAGLQVTVLPHPKGTKIGNMLYECLKEASCHECEVAIACAMHASIQPLLRDHDKNNDKVLILDRYWPSTVVYQNPTGPTRTLFYQSLRFWKRPDLFTFLRLPAEVAMSRKQALGQDPTEAKFEASAIVNASRYEDVFAELQDFDRNSVLILDATKTPQEVAKELADAVLRKLGKLT